MSENSLAIPTAVADPRCFVLNPVFDNSQAYTQAGEYKSKVFGFDPKQMLRTIGRRRNPGIEAELVERRLVPFWHIRCKSLFDYTRMKDYTIAANDPDAVSITVKGADQHGSPNEIVYRVDQSGRSGGQVKLTGIERCITKREETQWIDSYISTEGWLPPQLEAHQKVLEDSTKLRPRLVTNLEDFANHLTIDGEPLFKDDVRTILVPPLEAADNVVRRSLQRVMVSIEAATIYEWALSVSFVDLYFRPLYVFQFERFDQDGKRNGLKLEELDGLHKDRWVNLQTTEFQMSTIPWVQILKLSADIGAIMLQDVPVLGTGLKIASTVVGQAPGIIDDIRK